MNAWGFAWRSLVRQPARALLGVLGVAAVGALLFDMLMLSNGLIVSMGDLLARTGFDIRVTTGSDLPRGAVRIAEATATADRLLAVPLVRAAIAIRFADGSIERDGTSALAISVQGVSGSRPLPWTVVRGADAEADGDVVVNDALATAMRLTPGSALTLRTSCATGAELLPAVPLRVAGVAEFPFEAAGEYTVATGMPTLDRLCGGNARDEAEVILVTSQGDPEATARAVRQARPDLQALTNDEMLGRLQQTSFTYFRQISSVLITVTLSFALLLITVLLTVSVNQRLGEIAALRALGLSRGRVVADVLCESVIIVGLGGLLSIPAGALLATVLDRILKGMPGIPAAMHFFVFQAEALGWHVLLLAVTAGAAALYTMRLVFTLPIAATLRKEVTS
jgi:putative ABC transport system permease protein